MQLLKELCLPSQILGGSSESHLLLSWLDDVASVWTDSLLKALKKNGL